MASGVTRQGRNWVRLDNASNIFLAAMNARDTKVYRMSAEVADTVDPELLQQALDKVYEQYPLYQSVLRRGVFWYYLEKSELKPRVRLDTNPTCEALYHFDRRELLFRVIYWKNRINIEVFHVLSDGTGSMWFFQDLLREYLYLRYPETQALESSPTHGVDRIHLTEDSFERHFRKKEQRNFTQAAQSAIRTIGELTGKYMSSNRKKASSVLEPVAQQETKKKVYQVKGTYTPDNRPRVIEMEMPVKQVLALAKSKQVSLTLYLIALFMESVRLAADDFHGNETMAVSVPVNLRQFFPSHSMRNFFSTTRLEYQYKKDKENSISEICAEMKEQFDSQLTKESLEDWLTRLIEFEYHPIGRILIRPLKDWILKMINRKNNKNLTIAISNLGRTSFPSEINDYIEKVFFHTIAIRPQFCVISHGDTLTITFSGPYVETGIQREFAKLLHDEGIPITIAVNKVTQEELGEEA